MLKKLAIFILANIILIAGGLAIARATLPNTACAVTEAQFDKIVLEKMSYDDVKAALGCDGVLKRRDDYGPQLLAEEYSWRGDAWPYGRFDGTFYNRQIHATSKLWLNLEVSANKD